MAELVTPHETGYGCRNCPHIDHCAGMGACERGFVTRDQAIANCPTPEYHETHRYCPSCPWTEPQEPQVQVVDLPADLSERVTGWLRSNQREAVELRHGVFPLGMVRRWIERAEEAEAEVELRAEAARMPWSFHPGTLRERLEWCRVQHQLAADNPPLHPPTREQKADFDRACVAWYEEMVAQCDELLRLAGRRTS